MSLRRISMRTHYSRNILKFPAEKRENALINRTCSHNISRKEKQNLLSSIFKWQQMCSELTVATSCISCLEFCLKPRLKFSVFQTNTFVGFKPFLLAIFKVRNRLFAARVSSFPTMAASTCRRHCEFVGSNLKISARRFQVSRFSVHAQLMRLIL